jgi:hypothetical protein
MVRVSSRNLVPRTNDERYPVRSEKNSIAAHPLVARRGEIGGKPESGYAPDSHRLRVIQ